MAEACADAAVLRDSEVITTSERQSQCVSFFFEQTIVTLISEHLFRSILEDKAVDENETA